MRERDVTPRGLARAARGMVVVLALPALLAGVAGCTSQERPAAGHPSAAPLKLDASVAQFRYAEGTPDLRAGVTNQGDREIRVSSATIVWGGFAFPTVPIPDPVTQPGQTAAFTIAYGAPRCDGAPDGKPTLVAVIDGKSRRLPLRVEDPQLLVRLHDKACASERLDEVADVSLRWGSMPERVRGDLYLPGTLLVRHRVGPPQRVTIVDLGGSVLLDLVTRRPGLLPLATTRTRAVPVLLGSSHRCDAHALGQSSQTFLISAYVRLQGAPVQRVILIPTKAEQVRIFALIHRVCGSG